MPVTIQSAKEIIAAVALDIVMMDGRDPELLNGIIDRLEGLENFAENDGVQPLFVELLTALKIYLKKVIAGETGDIGPFERGIDTLQRCLEQPVPFTKDLSALLAELNGKPAAEPTLPQPVHAPTSVHLIADEEDHEVTLDFVMESLEDLGGAETGLIDLEQQPDRIDIINLIFRTFHTIKGVSGFLKLFDIHRVAHHAENLLEKARDLQIQVDKAFINIVLETVDGLRQLFEGIHSNLLNQPPLDMDIDLEQLIQRIEGLGKKTVSHLLPETAQPAQKAPSPEDLMHGSNGDNPYPENFNPAPSSVPFQMDGKLSDRRKSLDHSMELQVKVDTKKLDTIVDLTGELVIAQAMLRQSLPSHSLHDQVLHHRLQHLTRITSGLQTAAMSMRMVPIKATFQKMVRIVRDLAQRTAKEVRLTMSGEDTEIDRNMVDHLYEPMVHMIRNAVDHGIESPSERRAEGKPPAAEIRLCAYHQSGQFVIIISDDGRGLDKKRIIEKAEAAGVISAQAHMDDKEIYDLIFNPGLSTARKVTDLSGRGMGMDVVKKCIDRLKGHIGINTLPGMGTAFEIRMPLTLAIMDGMLVGIGGERYIIPTISICASFRPDKKDCITVGGKGEMVLSRGRLIPMVRLNRLFGLDATDVSPWQALIVEVCWEDRPIGLLLDELLAKEEVVIKSLGETFQNVDGIAGCAVLGDGRVGLILDVAGIWKMIR